MIDGKRKHSDILQLVGEAVIRNSCFRFLKKSAHVLTQTASVICLIIVQHGLFLRAGIQQGSRFLKASELRIISGGHQVIFCEIAHLFIQGNTKLRCFCVLRQQHLLVSGKEVEGIQRQILLNPGGSLLCSSKLSQQIRLQASRLDVVGVFHQRAFDVGQGSRQSHLCGSGSRSRSMRPVSCRRAQPGSRRLRIDGRQIIEGHLLLLVAPGSLIERIIGFLVPSLIQKIQTKQIIGLAVVGIGISFNQTLQRLTEIFFRLTERSSSHQQRAVGVVDADIARIPLQSFQIVGIRQIGGMPVLLDMKSGQIQLLIGLYGFRILRRLCGIGKLRDFHRFRRVFHQAGAIRRINRHMQILLSHAVRRQSFLTGHKSRYRHLLFINVHRRQLHRLIQHHISLYGKHHMGIFPQTGGVNDHMSLAVRCGQMHRRLGGGIFHLSHRLIGHKILGKGLFLKGLQPGEIRLVVRKYARHQFHVRAVCIRQVAVPCLSEISTAPGPLLLAGRNVVIRHMQDSSFFSIIVAAHEVIFGLLRHIGGGHGNVLITGNVHALAVVLLIINAGGDGEPGYIPLTMIHHRMHIGREDGLGIVVDRNRRIRPPQEGLRHAGTVVELADNLYVRLSGIQADFRDSLGTVHLIHIMKQHGYAAVLILQGHIIHRKEGGRPVVLRPVELNASGNPGSGQSHQRRLDHMVIINKIIIVRLVIGPLDPAAQFRQHHHLQVLIFQPDRRVLLVGLLFTDFLHRGIGIHLSAASLIHTLVQKNGILFRFSDFVGGNCNLLHPHLCLAHGKPPFFEILLQGSDTFSLCPYFTLSRFKNHSCDLLSDLYFLLLCFSRSAVMMKTKHRTFFVDAA